MNSTEDKAKKQFWIILLIVFMGFLGISMPYLIFPALFLNPSYSILSGYTIHPALLLGITLAVYPLGQFIGSPILGALSDDYGRKRLLVGSLLLNAFFNLWTGLSLRWESVELLIISRFLSGLMEGNIAIARAMASDIKSISKHVTFGKINAAVSIAFLVGPLLGSILIDNSLYEGLTISTPFYCISLLFFGLSGVSIFVLCDSQVSQRSIEVRSVWQRLNLFKRVSVLFQNEQLKFLMIVSTSFSLAADIFYEFGPVYLTAKWTFGPTDLISYNAILCAALAFSNGWLAGIVSKYFSRHRIVIYSTGWLGALLIAVVLTDSSKTMFLLVAAIGVAIGLVVTLLTVKISDSVSDSIQGEVMGVQIALRVLGDAIICLFGGVLLLLSPKLILLFASAIAGMVMFYYARKAVLYHSI